VARSPLPAPRSCQPANASRPSFSLVNTFSAPHVSTVHVPSRSAVSKTGSLSDIPAATVRAAKGGDPDALEEVVRRLYPLVSKWALIKTGNPEDAQDVTQETMIRVSKYIGRFDERSRVSTWAYQVTSNAAADHHRRSRRHLRLAQDGDAGAGQRTEAPVAAQALDDKAAAGLVRAFFQELPERQREVFHLTDLQGYRSSEVAEMLGMNPATVRGHLLRARRFIRRKILEANPMLVEAYGREL
jgi:RNA polymerase sigma-70 factor (ECF subfamily)